MTISNNSTGLRPGVCLSTSRPTSPYTGQVIYETDTGIYQVWNNEWLPQWPFVQFNQRTASYTLVLTDRGKMVEILSASTNTLTVPLNSTVPYPIGTQITVLQTGAGQTTITATSGVTINATPGLKLRTQWSSATLIKRATNTWVAVGDLMA